MGELTVRLYDRRRFMKHRPSQMLFAALVCAVIAVAAFAQADAKKAAGDKRSPIVNETASNWKRAKKWTLDYIDAMPEGAMSFKPTPEVRSFAEQMLHLAFWNFGLIEAAGGK